jgi:hypothetical protein
MKRCYNYEILWVSIFALLLLVVAALQPYKTEGFAVNAKQLDGENLNNHSCPTLMNNSIYLKDHYNKFNKNAKMIASFMEPGLSEEYMETESKKHLKGMCIIPDNKITSYNLFVQEDPVKGGPSQICKASITDNITREEKEVIMPYVSDVNSGCALVFSEYGNNHKQVERLLDNLHILSNEYNEKVKANKIEQKNVKQNEYNSFDNANTQINNEERTYNNMTTNLTPEVQRSQSQLDMVNAVYNQQKQQKQYYENKLTPTWY